MKKQCILNCGFKFVHSATNVVCMPTAHRRIQLCMLETLSPHDHEWLCFTINKVIADRFMLWIFVC